MTEESRTIGDRVGTAKFAELMKRARESESEVRFDEGGLTGGPLPMVNRSGAPEPILGPDAFEELKDETDGR